MKKKKLMKESLRNGYKNQNQTKFCPLKCRKKVK